MGTPEEGDCELRDIFETVYSKNYNIVDLGYLPGELFIEPLEEMEDNGDWFEHPRWEEIGKTRQENDDDSKEIRVVPTWEGKGPRAFLGEKSDKEEIWTVIEAGMNTPSNTSTMGSISNQSAATPLT
ncbi:hypothetical protein R1flu_023950 [Riccia fluitans]|uniref:Uncharacterized protein n=1 Tax=Riccia fluitans TaxID=41844 RepID=A0ABD1XUC1_9MARC